MQVLQIRDSALLGWPLVFQLPCMPAQGLRTGRANIMRAAMVIARLAPRLRHALYNTPSFLARDFISVLLSS